MIIGINFEHNCRRSNVFKDAKFWFLAKPNQSLSNLPKKVC